MTRWWWTVALLTGCASARDAMERARDEAPLLDCGCEARGIAAGRDAPGGDLKLWLADRRAVREIDADGGERVVWTAPRMTEIVRFEAADLDADGDDDWVVQLDAGRMRGTVVLAEPAGRRALPPVAGWLRTLGGPDGRPLLWTQRTGGDAPFRGAVEVMRIDGDTLRVGEAVDLPLAVDLYSAFWLPGGERGRLFVIEPTDHVTERDPRSPKSILWRSDGRPAARPMEIDRQLQDLLGESVEDSLRIPAPVAIWPGPDGPELIFVAGSSSPVPVLSNLRVLAGGDVRRYGLADRGLVEKARSPVLGLQVVAAAPWRVGDRPVIAAAVWIRTAGGLQRPSSRVFLIDPASGDLVDPAGLREAADATPPVAPAPPVDESPSASGGGDGSAAGAAAPTPGPNPP